MKEERGTCGATFRVGDADVFVCGMSPHKGRHSHEGRRDGHPFFIMWEGDMRTECRERGGSPADLVDAINPT